MLSRKDKILCLIFLIVSMTAIVHYPSLNNGFINWDDNEYVGANMNIRNISWENIKDNFTSPYYGNYIPFTTLTYAVEYRLAKLNPRAYHATNLILHLFNCMLVFWLIYLLSGKEYVALIVALLFGIHPLHVESVAWVSERKDVLYSFFFLSSLISYTRYLKEKKVYYWSLSLLLFAASCLSKPMAVTLPLVLFLIDYLLHQKVEIKTLLLKIPFISISLIFGIISLLTQYGASNSRPENLFSFFGNLLRASYGLIFYLYKIILPVHLSGFYPIPKNIAGTYPITLLFSPLVIVLLALLIIIVFRHNRKAVFGTVFFFITILPVIQLMPVGWAIAADRYTYVPALGIFYIFGEVCSWFYTQKLSGRKHLKAGFFSFLALLLVVLSILSWQRCHIWKDGITFWNDVIIKYPTAALGYNNRGIAYTMKGDDRRAIEDYKTAVRLEPSYLPALANLLITYCRSGMSSTATFLYDATVRQSPETEKRLMDFGKSTLENNDTNNAISLYMTLLRILPEKAQRYLNGEIYNNLALAYHRTKQFKFAKYYAKKAKDSGYSISRELQTYAGSGE